MTEHQGDRIKKIRKYFKLSQDDLAKAIGIKQPSIAYIEKNGVASSDVMLNISTAYKVNLNWLMKGEGEMLPTPEKAETKNEGAVFLSAAALYTMWQDSEKKAREERTSMIQVMLSLSEQIKEKDAIIKSLATERPKVSSKTAG